MSLISKIPGLYTIPQGHCALVETHGKYTQTLLPGLNIINPLTTSLKSLKEWTWTFPKDTGAETKYGPLSLKEEWTCAKPGNLMELTEQQWLTNSCTTYTKDRIEIQAKASLNFIITDPYKAAYSIDVLPRSIHNEAHAALRAEMSKIEFAPYFFSNKARFFEKQEALNSGLKNNLQQRVQNWGVEILRAEVGPFEYCKSDVLALQERRFSSIFFSSVIASVIGLIILGNTSPIST